MSADPEDVNFNWFDFLDLKMIDVREDQVNLASYRANDWVTCACGHLCNALPKYKYDDGPEDSTLRELGMNFYMLIDDMYVNHRTFDTSCSMQEWRDQNNTYDELRLRALSILKDIENRTNELLKELAI